MEKVSLTTKKLKKKISLIIFYTVKTDLQREDRISDGR